MRDEYPNTQVLTVVVHLTTPLTPDEVSELTLRVNLSSDKQLTNKPTKNNWEPSPAAQAITPAVREVVDVMVWNELKQVDSVTYRVRVHGQPKEGFARSV